mgnify:CR=1 FL=1
MCLAVPSKIIEIEDTMAIVDVMGLRKQISLLLLPEEPQIGELCACACWFCNK